MASSSSQSNSSRSLRQRNYAMESVQIGTFIVNTTLSTNVYSNKLRIYFKQNQIVYDFEYVYFTGHGTIRNTFLVAVCVPFHILTGICCKNRDLYFTISEPPRMITGSNGIAVNQRPPPDGVDFTNGQLAGALYHKVTLCRAQGLLVQQHLLECTAMNFAKLFFDVTPTGQIVYNVEDTPPLKLPSPEESTKDASEGDDDDMAK